MLDVKGYLRDQIVLAAAHIGCPLNVAGAIDDLLLRMNGTGEINWLYQTEKLAALLYLTAKPADQGLLVGSESASVLLDMLGGGENGLILTSSDMSARIDMAGGCNEQRWMIETDELSALLDLFLSAQYLLEFGTLPVDGYAALRGSGAHLLELEGASPMPTVLSKASGQAVMEFAAECAALMRLDAEASSQGIWEFHCYADAVLSRYRRLSEIDDLRLGEVDGMTLLTLDMEIKE